MEKNEIIKLLRTRELKATSNRIELLGLIAQKKSAISKNELQQSFKSVDRVTLYRTLKSLIDARIIHIAHQDKQETFYALCKEDQCKTVHHDHHHAHFKCEICLQITCVDLSEKPSLNLSGYLINHINIQVNGVCNNCL